VLADTAGSIDTVVGNGAYRAGSLGGFGLEGDWAGLGSFDGQLVDFSSNTEGGAVEVGNTREMDVDMQVKALAEPDDEPLLSPGLAGKAGTDIQDKD
jgi:hypothetical protein